MKIILSFTLFLTSATSFAAGCGGISCPPRTHCINGTLCSPNLNPDSELKGNAVWILPQNLKSPFQTPAACDPQAELTKI